MSPKFQIKSKGMGKWTNTFDLGEDKIFRLLFIITKKKLNTSMVSNNNQSVTHNSWYK